LNEAIQKAVTEVLLVASKPNKLWIKASTILLAKEKREMKQRRQESTEHEKEYRRLCNAVRKAARNDKKDWLQEQCQEIERCAEGNRAERHTNS
jgi:hypothetical protein